eukprot:COSAG01_NODE_49650_length_370_cov_0.952030_1_plen_55_part_01
MWREQCGLFAGAAGGGGRDRARSARARRKSAWVSRSSCSRLALWRSSARRRREAP